MQTNGTGLAVIDDQRAATEIVRSQAAMQFAEIKQFAEEIAKSGLFALTPPQALTLMLLAQSQGLPFIQGAIRYHVIKGKPSMKADVRMAEFLRIGGTVEWIDYTEEKATARFAHPKHCPKGIVLTVTLAKMDELRISQEWDKDSKKFYTKEVWKRTPGAMLRATLERQAITMICPGIAAGVPTEEEIEATVIDVTPKEQTAHSSLTARLAERQAPIRERVPSVAETIQTIKEVEQTHQAMQKPPEDAKSDCRLWVEETLASFNAEFVPATHEKAIHSNQVINHVVGEAVKLGTTNELLITRADGKQDHRAVGKEFNRLWNLDESWVMQEVSNYLASKLPQPAAVAAEDDEYAGVTDDFPSEGAQ